MIKQYSTPYEYFILPFLAKEIDELKITYVQNGEEILTKTNEDIQIIDIGDVLDNASMGEDFAAEIRKHLYGRSDFLVICVHLTQEDSAKFHFYKAAEKNIALIQIHLKDTKGDAFVSRPIFVRIYGTLDKGVL